MPISSNNFNEISPEFLKILLEIYEKKRNSDNNNCDNNNDDNDDDNESIVSDVINHDDGESTIF